MTELPYISSLYTKAECMLIHSTVFGLIPPSKQKGQYRIKEKAIWLSKKDPDSLWGSFRHLGLRPWVHV